MAQGTRTGGWSAHGKLRVGGQALGPASPSLNFQVDFMGYRIGEEGRLQLDPRQRPASTYTVEFEVDTSDIPITAGVGPGFGPLSPFLHVNPIAFVEFSTEGNSVRRSLSVVNGSSITGVCDHVSIKVFDATRNFEGGPVPPGTDLEYDVSILVTPGTRPAKHVPPYLQGLHSAAVLGGGVFVDIPIPRLAGVATVAVYAIEEAVLAVFGIARVQFINFGGIIIGQYSPLGSPQFVPIPPGTAVVRLINVSVGGSVSMNAVLGIDG